VAQPAPKVTYTWDGTLYHGTDGSTFTATWDKYVPPATAPAPAPSYVAPAAPAIPPPAQRSYEEPSYQPGSFESQVPDGSWYFDQSKYDAAHR
jgi:hypothetical protein